MLNTKLEKIGIFQEELNFINEFDKLFWDIFISGKDQNLTGLIFDRTYLENIKKFRNLTDTLKSSVFLSFMPEINLSDLSYDEHSYASELCNLPFIYAYFMFILSIYKTNKKKAILVSGLSYKTLEKLNSIPYIELAKIIKTKNFTFKIRFSNSTLKGLIEAKNKSSLRKFLLLRNQEILMKLFNPNNQKNMIVTNKSNLYQLIKAREMLKFGYYKIIISLETGLSYKFISKIAQQLEKEGVVLKDEIKRVSQTSRLNNKIRKSHAAIFCSIYLIFCEVEGVDSNKVIDIILLNSAYKEYCLIIAELLKICDGSDKDKNNLLSINQCWNLAKEIIQKEATLYICKCCKKYYIYSYNMDTKKLCPFC